MSFLKKLFGSSCEEVWQEFASEIGGEFADGEGRLSPSVRFDIDGWPATLSWRGRGETGTITYVVAAFKPENMFEFHITPAGLIELGRDVSVGDEGFDSAFVVESDNEEQVRALLDDDELRGRLLAEKPRHVYTAAASMFFSAFDEVDCPEVVAHDPNLAVAVVEHNGVVDKIERLLGSVDLAAVTIEQLVSIGCASAEPPQLPHEKE